MDDYSDVAVVEADGRIVPWRRATRLDAAEMDRTMHQIVDRLYTFLRNLDAAELEALASGIVESGGRPDTAGGAPNV